jgi:hypothetical protein
MLWIVDRIGEKKRIGLDAIRGDLVRGGFWELERVSL